MTQELSKNSIPSPTRNSPSRSQSPTFSDSYLSPRSPSYLFNVHAENAEKFIDPPLLLQASPLFLNPEVKTVHGQKIKHYSLTKSAQALLTRAKHACNFVQTIASRANTHNDILADALLNVKNAFKEAKVDTESTHNIMEALNGVAINRSKIVGDIAIADFCKNGINITKVIKDTYSVATPLTAHCLSLIEALADLDDAFNAIRVSRQLP